MTDIMRFFGANYEVYYDVVNYEANKCPIMMHIMFFIMMLIMM